MKKLSLLPFFILSILLFVSCNKSIVFDNKFEFQNANWSFEEKAVNFEATLKGSENPYTIVLELELTGTPNVDMFYATFTMITPNGGKTIKSITFNFLNPHEPYIQGDSPNEKIYKLIVFPKKYFSETGTYSFEVNQFSNNADNYNIRALRMYIEKIKN